MNKQNTKQVIGLIKSHTILGRLCAKPEDIIKAIEIAYEEGLRDGRLSAMADSVEQLEDLWSECNSYRS